MKNVLLLIVCIAVIMTVPACKKLACKKAVPTQPAPVPTQPAK